MLMCMCVCAVLWFDTKSNWTPAYWNSHRIDAWHKRKKKRVMDFYFIFIISDFRLLLLLRYGPSRQLKDFRAWLCGESDAKLKNVSMKVILHWQCRKKDPSLTFSLSSTRPTGTVSTTTRKTIIMIIIVILLLCYIF